VASDGKDMTHVLGGRSAALKKLVDGGRLPLDTPDNRGVGHSGLGSNSAKKYVRMCKIKVYGHRVPNKYVQILDA